MSKFFIGYLIVLSSLISTGITSSVFITMYENNSCEDTKCPVGTIPFKMENEFSKQCICFTPERHVYVMSLDKDGVLKVQKK